MVRMILKDGMELHCDIYDYKFEIQPLLNHERINCFFSQVDDKDFYIDFKTSTIIGKVHPSNVESYSIEHENEYSYSYPRSDGYMRDWC